MPDSYKNLENKIKVLINNAWEHEIEWERVDAWRKNFQGQFEDKDEEQLYAMLLLSKFIYFGKRLVREMLASLYKEHFESQLIQRIRRNLDNTLNVTKVRSLYQQELSATRFIGVGNPAESGAHLLYYFRQVNNLPKDLFSDINGAFSLTQRNGSITIKQRDPSISHYVFFDDLVGSGDQACSYLGPYLSTIRSQNPGIDFRFMSLFSTSKGLEKLNRQYMFDGNATCLFELDSSYKALSTENRYFNSPPAWFDKAKLEKIIRGYGNLINPKIPLGYRDGQLLLGFSHNTPDNTLPLFWCEGFHHPWEPAFTRYDKKYGG